MHPASNETAATAADTNNSPVNPAPLEKVTLVDRVMFSSRWLLYPMNAGLIVALIVYLMRFLFQVGLLIVHSPGLVTAPTGDDNELLVLVVSLLDQAMICSLLILTIMGGHQIYVRRFQDQLTAAGPYWLKRVDTIVLKVKLGLAFTGVSSVVILKDCISVTAVPQSVWISHVVIHVVFLGTTLITALVWRIMHPADRDAG